MARDTKRARIREKEWQRVHADELREYHRWKHIRKAYGIDQIAWLELFEKQGNCCGACGATSPGSKAGWHTDHVPGTKIVRGILCHHCNISLSKNVTAAILRKRAAYLEKHHGNDAI